MIPSIINVGDADIGYNLIRYSSNLSHLPIRPSVSNSINQLALSNKNSTLDEFVAYGQYVDLKKQVELKCGQREVVINFNLTEEEKSLLVNNYGNLHIKFKDSGFVTHALAHASRICEYNNVYFNLIKIHSYKTVSEKSSYNFLVKDIGGNRNFIVSNSLINVHSCNPILDVRDSARETEFLINYCCNSNFDSRFIRNFCNRKAQQCTLQAPFLTFIHSIYDITLDDLADILTAANCKIAYITFFFNPLILINDKGFIMNDTVFFEKYRRGDELRIKFSFVNDMSFSYDHSYAQYVALIKCMYLLSSDNKQFYLIEFQQNILDVQYVKIVHCTKLNIGQTKLSRSITYKSNYKILKYYSLTDCVDKIDRQHLKPRFYMVPEEVINRVIEFSYTLDEQKFKVQEVLKILASFNTKIIVDGRSIVKRNDRIESKDLLPIANALYIYIYSTKFEEGKVMQTVLDNIKSMREGKSVGVVCKGNCKCDSGDCFIIKLFKNMVKFFKCVPLTTKSVLSDITISDVCQMIEFDAYVNIKNRSHIKSLPYSQLSRNYLDCFLLDDDSDDSLTIVNKESAPLALESKNDSSEPDYQFMGSAYECDLHEYTLLNNHGGGDCMFYCLLYCLNQVTINDNFIQENSDKVGELKRKLHHFLLENNINNKELKNILLTKGAWGDESVLGLFVLYNKLRICVHFMDNTIIFGNIGEVYHFLLRDNHYQVMVPIEKDVDYMIHSVLPKINIDYTTGDFRSQGKLNNEKIKEVDNFCSLNEKIFKNRGARDRSFPLNDLIVKYNKFDYICISALKLIDILELINYKPKNPINVLDICAAPGGFCEVIFRGYSVNKYFAISHTDGPKFQPRIPISSKDKLFMVDNSVYNNDILNDQVVANTIYTIVSKGEFCDLIVADGGQLGTNFQNCDKNIELIINEHIIAFNCCNIGGTMIVKLFELNDNRILQLIFMLSQYFSNVIFVKPPSSRPGNSEIYIVYQYKLEVFDSHPVEFFEGKLQVQVPPELTVYINNLIDEICESRLKYLQEYKNFSIDKVNNLYINDSLEQKYIRLYTNKYRGGIKLSVPRFINVRKNFDLNFRKLYNMYLSNLTLIGELHPTLNSLTNLIKHCSNSVLNELNSILADVDCNAISVIYKEIVDTLKFQFKKFLYSKCNYMGYEEYCIGVVTLVHVYIHEIININKFKELLKNFINQFTNIANDTKLGVISYFVDVYDLPQSLKDYMLNLVSPVLQIETLKSTRFVDCTNSVYKEINDDVINDIEFSCTKTQKKSTFNPVKSIKKIIKNLKKDKLDKNVLDLVGKNMTDSERSSILKCSNELKGKFVVKVDDNNKDNMQESIENDDNLKISTDDNKQFYEVEPVKLHCDTENALGYDPKFTDNPINNALIEIKEFLKISVPMYIRIYKDIYSRLTMEIDNKKIIETLILNDPQNINLYNKTGNMICSSINKKNEYSVWFDGEEFVNFGDNPRNVDYLIAGDYCELFIECKLYDSLKDLNYYSDCNIQLINGVPGCGKTTYIISNYNFGDLLLLATRQGKQDVISRLERENIKFDKNDVKTLHSYIINSKKFYNTVWIDEALMQHFGYIVAVASMSRAQVVSCMGDINQIPYINRSKFIEFNYSNMAKFIKPSKILNVSYRCPIDVACKFDNMYFSKLDKHFCSVNVSKLNTMSYEIYQNEHQLKTKLKPGLVILVFKQADKLIIEKWSEIKSMNIIVNTVHEFQGSQNTEILCIRFSVMISDPIYNSEPHVLVCLTRHTEKFVYMTKVKDNICRLIDDRINSDQLENCRSLRGGGRLTIGYQPISSYITYVSTKPECLELDIIDVNNVSLLNGFRYKKSLNIPILQFTRCKYRKLEKIFIKVPNEFSFDFKYVTEEVYVRCCKYIYSSGFINYFIKNCQYYKLNIYIFTDTITKDEKYWKVYDYCLVNCYPLNEYAIEEYKLENNCVSEVSFPRIALPSISDISIIQNIYDSILPGNSLIDRGFDNYLVHYSDCRMILSSINFMDNKFLNTSIYTTLQPNLRTSIEPKRIPSTLETLLAMLKRNLDVPRLSSDTDYNTIVPCIMDFVKSKLLNSVKFKTAKNNLINGEFKPNIRSIMEWMDDQPLSVIGQIQSEKALWNDQLNFYDFIIKRQPKPVLDTTAQSTYSALQTVVYHSKSINATFCVIFRYIKQTIIRCLKKNFLMFTDKATKDLERTVNKRFKNLINTKKPLELDIGKYDKSQGYLHLLLECGIMEIFGISKELILLWYHAHLVTFVKDKNNKVTAVIFCQRKSGDAATYPGNTIILLIVITVVLRDIKIYCILFSGDDSLIFVDEEVDINDIIIKFMYMFNFEAKLLNFKISKYFCSKFVISDDNGNIRFVPDPVKLITKLGRHDLVNWEHVEQYRISFYDNIIDTNDHSICDNLLLAVNERYNINLRDVKLLLGSLYSIASSRDEFAKLYYEPFGANLCHDVSLPGLDI